MARREFGSVRRLPSGRWQARYRDSRGTGHTSTHRARGDASRFLASVQTSLSRGDWIDPAAGSVLFRDYAQDWLALRRVRGRPLAPRTIELYESLLTNHINPAFGELSLQQVSVPRIRAWHGQTIGDRGPGAIAAAKCYRLLRAILATAVADELISRNPCTIKGAGSELSPERPIATLTEVFLIADTVPARFRALVLLATFCALRFGELAGLTRADVDLDSGTVQVVAPMVQPNRGPRRPGPPKSDAGRRTITIPAAILDPLVDHMNEFVGEPGSSLVFTGPLGASLHRGNFNRLWRDSIAKTGIEKDLHLHDLRHTGNTLAAATSASTKELMVRMGHASAAAALRYQHATRERDAAIADALSAMVLGVTSSSVTDPSPRVVGGIRRTGPD